MKKFNFCLLLMLSAGIAYAGAPQVGSDVTFLPADFAEQKVDIISTDDTTKLDTITIAKALEIGAALADGGVSEKQYVIGGYVSSIMTYFDAEKKTETFWMADTKESTAASNADGAFEVYNGKPTPEEEMGLHARVYVTTKIKKYKPKSGDAIIETDGTPSVNVVEKGVIDVPEVVTVAQAIEIGGKLSGVSEKRYEITGYVSAIHETYSSYGNETFFITDKKGERTNEQTKAFYVYRGKPDTKKEIGFDAKIKIICKLKNYNGTIENDGTNIPFEVLEQGTFSIDTITVTEAINRTKALPEGSHSFEFYAVKGYIARISTPYDASYGNMSFYMSDDPFANKSDFLCYRAKLAKEDAERTVKGAFVIVTGHLDNNTHGLQMYQGAEVFVGEAPHVDTISVARALEIGEALDEGASTDGYAIKGFVSSIEAEYEDELQSFTMSDEENASSGKFRAIDALIDEPGAQLYDDVLLVGKIEKVNGVIRVVKGHATVIQHATPFRVSYVYNQTQGRVDGPTSVYPRGTTISFTAIPYYGYRFSQWSDGIKENPRSAIITRDTTFVAEFAANPKITYIYNATQGRVYGPTTAEPGDTITFWASPNEGYYFDQWSDGVWDNYRTAVITKDTTFTAEFAISRSGRCGDGWALTWEYDPEKRMLTINGEGALNENIRYGVEAPKEMTELVISNGVTSIGSSAFNGIKTLTNVTISETVKTIGEQAFYNCSNLKSVINYRPTPTNAYSSSFDGVDKFECTLYVLASSIEMYKSAAAWRDFYYTKPIGASETNITEESVTVVAGENSVVIIWPTSATADTYNIVITKNGEVVCTLIFNANGQLVGITFASSRDGSVNAPSATLVANGMQFTITGLNSGTNYDYTVVVKSGEYVVASYSGEFETTGALAITEGLENTTSSKTPYKLLRNGQLLIRKGERTYTVTGQELK